jgi:hypothetical protein
MTLSALIPDMPYAYLGDEQGFWRWVLRLIGAVSEWASWRHA